MPRTDSYKLFLINLSAIWQRFGPLLASLRTGSKRGRKKLVDRKRDPVSEVSGSQSVSEWDTGEPVDIVFDTPFCPLVISLLQSVKIDGFSHADISAFYSILPHGLFLHSNNKPLQWTFAAAGRFTWSMYNTN